MESPPVILVDIGEEESNFPIIQDPLEAKFLKTQRPWEGFRYLIYIICFYTVIHLQLKTDSSYNINYAVHKTLTTESEYELEFHEIHNVTHAIEWL